MKYYATRPYKKQEKSLNNKVIIKKPETLLEKCKALSPLERKIANCLLSKSNECPKVFLGRPYLARYAGCSTRTISRALAVLKEIGLISWKSRHLHSHMFSFNPIIGDASFRKQASFFFKSLVFMPFALSYFMLASPSIPPKNISSCEMSSREILRNYIYIITEPKPNSGRIRTCERAREADFGSVFKKEIDMNEFKRSGSIIPDSVKKCGLHLTAIGEADLARYPDEAIKHAIDQLALASDVTDPFRYVCKIAQNWCKAKGIQPDHAFAGKHFELLRAELSSPRLVDTDLSELMGKKPKRENLKPNRQGYTTPRGESSVQKLHPEYEEPELSRDCCTMHMAELRDLHEERKILEPTYAQFSSLNDKTLGVEIRKATIENCGTEGSSILQINRKRIQDLREKMKNLKQKWF